METWNSANLPQDVSMLGLPVHNDWVFGAPYGYIDLPPISIPILVLVLTLIHARILILIGIRH